MNRTTDTTVSKDRSIGNTGSADAKGVSVSPQVTKPVLTEEMLARFASRAAAYDRENRFFAEDFEELRAAKYLLLPLPREFGGAGMTLAEVCREQRRSAYHAPATALAVNMHLYWIGVAADLWRRGDASLEWLLREAAAGEIFAAGHAESGNNVPSSAFHHEGGTCRRWLPVHGPEAFGSLTPVWTRFGMHGHGHQRSQPTEDCSRLHAAQHQGIRDQRNLGCTRHEGYQQR